MKQKVVMASLLIAFLFMALAVYYTPGQQAEAAGKTLNVVGLYSETADGSISYRIGTGKWIVIKVGDKIPDNAEIGVTVERDWIEISPSDNPNAVYEITGSSKTVIKKVANLLKEKSKLVSFPKAGGKIDPKFVNKMVVKQYLGRQVYRKNDKSSWQDIKYGDVLEASGTVKIIATNNTLNLVYPNGKEMQVVGPIKFTVEKVLKQENLYKYLNIAK